MAIVKHHYFYASRLVEPDSNDPDCPSKNCNGKIISNFFYYMGKNNDKTWVLKLCENYHKHNATDEKQNLQNLCSTRPDIPIDIASLIFEYLPSPLNIEEIVPSIIKENTQTN